MPQWRSCGPAELEYVAGDQSLTILTEERWSKDGGQGYACVVTAGLWHVREEEPV